MISTDIDVEHLAPLDADTIPDANQSHYCFSCENPMTGLYCAKCGQKNDNYRRSIFGLFVEVASSITAIENRIWRTWAMLMAKPGKVAREFADGRRTHWSSPVRVYLAMSIILFGFLNITGTQIFSFNLDVEPREGINKPETELTQQDLKVAFSVDVLATQKQINARNDSRNFYLIEKLILNREAQSEENQATIRAELDKVFSAVDDARTEIEYPQARSDAPQSIPDIITEQVSETTPPDTDPEDSSDEDIAPEETGNPGLVLLNGKEITASQASESVIKIIRDPSQVNQPIKVWLPRFMFMMMPFSMFIGALFIRGKENALLYDHLVHTAYIHAVAFLFLLFALILSRISSSNASFILFMIAMIIYLPLSLKRMFKRDWFKTIWTSYFVGLIYVFTIAILMFAVTATGLLSELVSA